MGTLEQEIIEKFQQLEPDAQQRVLESLAVQVQPAFNYDAWWGEVESLQATIRARLGDMATVDALSLLEELREELFADDESDTRTWEEVREDVERHRWTPPPGAKSSLELLREDRDS